jgi:hypothetical protein
MDVNATWGFINILECLSGAMTFEEKHRPDGGIPYEDEDKAEDGKKQKKNTEQDTSLMITEIHRNKCGVDRLSVDGSESFEVVLSPACR